MENSTTARGIDVGKGVGVIDWLAPYYELDSAALEVLQSRSVLKEKVVKGSGWNIEGGIRKDVRKLIEVANKLCACG